MTAPIARMGDMSSHGGAIITGALKSFVDGVPVARMGDLHMCPIYGHLITPLISGSPTIVVEGKPVARMGDRAACGAVIIGGSQKTIVK